jgi:hypothetical protein
MFHNVTHGAHQARIPQPDAEGEAIRALREDLREWILWDAQAMLDDLHRFEEVTAREHLVNGCPEGHLVAEAVRQIDNVVIATLRDQLQKNTSMSSGLSIIHITISFVAVTITA